MTTVAVVICAYTQQRWGDLQDSVESAKRQPERPEVVVVIDHEPELLARAAARWPELRVVPNTEDRGLSGARNTGVALTDADVVAFLDDDATADPDWLGHMLTALEDPDVVGVGGRATPSWPTATGPGPYADELLWIVGCSYRGLPETPGDVRNVIGSSMAFRRDAILLAGGFRSGIGRVGNQPLGCEETELCIRIAQARPGARIRHEPRSNVSHRVSPDRVTMRYLRRRSYYEGISKAVLSRRVGTGDSLASESTYLTRVIPGAVLRELRHVGRGGGLRAYAIALSVVSTVAGYAVGRVLGTVVVRTPPAPAPLPQPVGTP
ncbi:glycosyltransferase family 2 protein [Curtobacterium sp. MCPF17_003]|uniref:glycosyltransferase family 2 protein n=1 Tax=unclassified Curtobacterium TaxID=257496 RepID=UPI000D9EE83F|nr:MULTISPECIES: glycosyltransferase family 2 protein [unclassified Curtobacterium]PYY59491.1 glycosyltransferase family 2 protein [Curtobacterium sp. MCPF17_003]PZE71487.1 glycosyltransferase family 2 protein [Curtobacterium sp. MCPF17_018]PZF25659.1 glycosyltransferase family 2 protein [Curtobacterium sp. MCPF17_051]